MPLQRRIQAVKLYYSLILKFKRHFVGANFHSVLGHTELLDEALRIEQVCKIDAIFHTEIVVTLSKFVWGCETVNE